MDIRLIAKVLRARSRLRAHEAWTPQDMRAHQDRAVAELRTHAMQHSRFYQRFHRGLEHAPLQELPILEKRELMGSFDELLFRHTRGI